MTQNILLAKQEQSIRQLILCGADLYDDILPRIGAVIFQIIGDLGVKTLPDKAAEQRLAHYLLNYYQDLTTTEIRLAFELAVVGKLEVAAEHYNSFDIKYVCRILNAYRKLRKIESRKIALEAEKKERERPPSKEELEQSLLEFLESLNEQYLAFAAGCQVKFRVVQYTYNFLRQYRILVVKEADWIRCKLEAEKLELQYKTCSSDLPKISGQARPLALFLRMDNNLDSTMITKQLLILEMFQRLVSAKVDFLEYAKKMVFEEGGAK